MKRRKLQWLQSVEKVTDAGSSWMPITLSQEECAVEWIVAGYVTPNPVNRNVRITDAGREFLAHQLSAKAGK